MKMDTERSFTVLWVSLSMVSLWACGPPPAQEPSPDAGPGDTLDAAPSSDVAEPSDSNPDLDEGERDTPQATDALDDGADVTQAQDVSMQDTPEVLPEDTSLEDEDGGSPDEEMPCEDDAQCEQGLSCCGGQCVDQTSDREHCGACDNACPVECGPGVCLRAVQIDAGDEHTCAVLNNGTVRCFGDSQFHEAGFRQIDPDDWLSWIPNRIPLEIEGIDDAVQVTAGVAHSCALHADGGVSCWGGNIGRQLALGDTGLVSATPVRIEGLSGVTFIESGQYHTCAVLPDGDVTCWGNGGFLNLPRDWPPPTRDNPGPRLVSGIHDVKSISFSDDDGLWLHNDGTISAFGQGTFGEMGPRLTEVRSQFVRLEGLRATQVFASGTHSCAVDLEGQLWCWGANHHFQVGPFSCGECYNPMPVPNAINVTSAALWRGYSISLFTNQAGQVMFIGNPGVLNSGQSFEPPENNPGLPKSFPNTSIDDFFIDIVAHPDHYCALSQRGQIYCAGSNAWGQLGRDGSGIAAPVQW